MIAPVCRNTLYTVIKPLEKGGHVIGAVLSCCTTNIKDQTLVEARLLAASLATNPNEMMVKSCVVPSGCLTVKIPRNKIIPPCRSLSSNIFWILDVNDMLNDTLALKIHASKNHVKMTLFGREILCWYPLVPQETKCFTRSSQE